MKTPMDTRALLESRLPFDSWLPRHGKSKICVNPRQRDRRVPTWLLRARVTPPRHLHSLIRRERVIKALTAASRAPIVVLTTPPGYGKSVALGQWVHERVTSGGRSAWLTFHSTDDPDSAVQYLAFAFHMSGLDLSCTELLDQCHEPPLHCARALQVLTCMR